MSQLKVGDRVRYNGTSRADWAEMLKRFGVRVGDEGVVEATYPMDPHKCVEVRFDYMEPDEVCLFGLLEDLFIKI